MTVDRIFVYGASGHGKVVADALLAGGVDNVEGFVDDDLARQTVFGLPVLGDGEWLRREAASGNVGIALGIGDNSARQAVASRCESWGIKLVPSIHPRAVVAKSAEIGPGAVVMAGAVINPDARIGRGAIINTGAVVEHDVVVGAFAHLSPNAATGGGAVIGDFAHLGLGAVVLPGVRVGRAAIVGAGAVVVCDLPDGAVAVGVPARVRRYVQIPEAER